MTKDWFVRNVRDMQWYERGPRGKTALLVEDDSAQVGVNVFVLGPGERMAMYHWEKDQEGYLVLSGEALLVVEGEERPLKQWDFVHMPGGMRQPRVFLGAGPGAVILAVGARQHQADDDWGGYPLDDAAARHDAASPVETNDPKIAYARFPAREPVPYDGWLP